MSDSYKRLVELGKLRFGELKLLADKLFEHMPPGDLAKILFPPALGLDLLRGALSEEPSEDKGFSIDLPDRGFYTAALDVAQWLSQHYFKTSVDGAEHVPAEGAALIVGNHSAGLMPLDAMFAMARVRERCGPERFVHPLVHDFAYVGPNIAVNARRLGILRATKENAAAAFAAGRLVLVYPGGDKEAFRTFMERDRVVLAGRKGFVRLALSAGVPILPLASVGLHESFIVLAKGERLARALGLKELLRTEVLPVGLSFPWGLAPSFFPFLPLPTSVEMRFLPPILLEGDPEDPAVVEDGYARVEAALQGAVDDLSKNRIPWFGR
ncbi:MAG: acyltransferase family protein [Proteobacteria bacterium]|jgi:1-acyl-sn-glycerol-3-phosphate acyltransferase|nr:acyltransferase family protein [Pseudomonadota bacterium]